MVFFLLPRNYKLLLNKYKCTFENLLCLPIVYSYIDYFG